VVFIAFVLRSFPGASLRIVGGSFRHPASSVSSVIQQLINQQSANIAYEFNSQLSSPQQFLHYLNMLNPYYPSVRQLINPIVGQIIFSVVREYIGGNPKMKC
jgi:hypothetical protein